MASDEMGRPLPGRPTQRPGPTPGPGLPRRRAPARLRWILAGLLLLPVLELIILIEVGQRVGTGPVLLALFVSAVLGIVVARRKGGEGLKQLEQALRTGRSPARGMADAALLVLAGLLLIVPGFLTDAFALLLLLPLTRPLARRPLERALDRAAADQVAMFGAAPGPGQAWTRGGDAVEGEVIDGDVVDGDPPA